MPCTYPLTDIQAQMGCVADMNLTNSASTDIRSLGMTESEALKVVRALTDADFDKTMESNKVPGVFQDVYKVTLGNRQLYVKFSWWEKFREYRVISFHEA